MDNSNLLVGYNRQITTPKNGTWLGGYGNGKDRGTIGKMNEDDDLFVTAIAMQNGGERILVMTTDLVRMPLGLFTRVRDGVVKVLGLKEDHIMLCATHSPSTPDAVDSFLETVDIMREWGDMFVERAVQAAVLAFEDLKPAKIFGGIKTLKNHNFVRRYMKDGEFLGTNRAGGDAHETPADNRMQILRFVREGGKDIILANWGAHCDHSKQIGGEDGTPDFHKGCSADYNYMFRKTVEEKTGAQFAFFQAAAGNLNPTSLIKEEYADILDRAKASGVKPYITYGTDLGEALLSALDTLEPLDGGNINGMTEELSAQRPKGIPVDSREYRQVFAVSVITYGKATLETPTEESKDGARFIMEKYNLGDEENLMKILDDPNHELNMYARCANVLLNGGCLGGTDFFSKDCAGKLANYFGMRSGPYSSGGILSKARNSSLEPITLPLYAVSCGDIAFAGIPGEPFTSVGETIKSESPFKMTFICEMCGGTMGYFPSKLAWSHGGYEVDATACAEGTAENIADKLSDMLKEMK